MVYALEGFDWENVIWNVFGLPAFDSTFCLTGDELYFEKGPDGNVKLKKSEFTGQVIISGVVAPKEADSVFFLNFELTFCGGILTKSELVNFKIETAENYKLGFQKFEASIVKDTKRRKSKWFRFFYKPYYYTLTFTTMLFVELIQMFLRLIIWLVDKMIPIKL